MTTVQVALAVALCALPAKSRAEDFTGIFEPVAAGSGTTEVSGALEGDDAGEMRLARKTMVITGQGVTLETGLGDISMTYTLHGDYLLGKHDLGGTEMYYPIYLQDQDTVILSGQKYVRVKA